MAQNNSSSSSVAQRCQKVEHHALKVNEGNCFLIPTPITIPSSPLYDGVPTLTDCCSAHFLSHWWQTCLYGHLALEQKARKKDALQAILGACNVKVMEQRSALGHFKQVA